MFFILFLIFFSLVIFWGFFILSFNFNNFVLDSNLKSFYQSVVCIEEAENILPIVMEYYNTNGSGLNDATSGFIDQNKNDDNFSCYKNFGNFEDDDCWGRALILFVPPLSEINIGYYKLSGNFIIKCEENNSGLQILLDGNKGQIVQDFITGLDLNLNLGNGRIILKNKNLSWIQCQIFLDNFIDFSTNSGSWILEYNYKFVNSQFKEIFGTKFVKFTGYIPPINPVGFDVISGDFNDGGIDPCQGTGNNDIVLSWRFTGDYNLSGEYQFEILSGNDADLGNVLTGLKLTDICFLNGSGNWQCQWTGYDYTTGDYYFKVNAYRCIDGSCLNIMKNIWGSFIKEVHIDYCK